MFNYLQEWTDDTQKYGSSSKNITLIKRSQAQRFYMTLFYTYVDHEQVKLNNRVWLPLGAGKRN